MGTSRAEVLSLQRAQSLIFLAARHLFFFSLCFFGLIVAGYCHGFVISKVMPADALSEDIHFTFPAD